MRQQEDTRTIRPRVTYSDTTRSTLLGLLIEFREGPAKFLRGPASSRQEGRTTMTFGNLLSGSAERNPRRAAIVLEKQSISHVLRRHAAPYRNSSATPCPRRASTEMNEAIVSFNHRGIQQCRSGSD